MALVDQTVLNSSSTRGNCLRASLASVLDINIDDIPEFENMGNGRWKHALESWAESKNINLLVYSGDVCVDVPYLAIGMTMYGGKHCCVYCSGALLHDPHPSRAGLESVQYTMVVSK